MRLHRGGSGACGTGVFAARLQAENPTATLVAIDSSARMVELARGRGVDARVADATALPFDDACCDVVAAMWMLYHVPDLDGALAQVRRVLRPGGLFVAVTNGEKHLASLLREAGGEPLSTQFSTQNGRARPRDPLRRRRAGGPHHAGRLPRLRRRSGLPRHRPRRRTAPFTGERRFAGATTVFSCR